MFPDWEQLSAPQQPETGGEKSTWKAAADISKLAS
jgi:hypothetical protein